MRKSCFRSGILDWCNHRKLKYSEYSWKRNEVSLIRTLLPKWRKDGIFKSYDGNTASFHIPDWHPIPQSFPQDLMRPLRCNWWNKLDRVNWNWCSASTKNTRKYLKQNYKGNGIHFFVFAILFKLFTWIRATSLNWLVLLYRSMTWIWKTEMVSSLGSSIVSSCWPTTTFSLPAYFLITIYTEF